jgi:hypothetical protein
VDEAVSVNRLEHCYILRCRPGRGIDKLDESLLSVDLRQRYVIVALMYRLDIGQEPYRLAVEQNAEVTAAR